MEKLTRIIQEADEERQRQVNEGGKVRVSALDAQS